MEGFNLARLVTWVVYPGQPAVIKLNLNQSRSVAPHWNKCYATWSKSGPPWSTPLPLASTLQWPAWALSYVFVGHYCHHVVEIIQQFHWGGGGVWGKRKFLGVFWCVCVVGLQFFLQPSGDSHLYSNILLLCVPFWCIAAAGSRLAFITKISQLHWGSHHQIASNEDSQHTWNFFK